MEQTGYYIAIFAVSNFVGALVLSPLFDTVGRVRMIAGGVVEIFLGVKAEGEPLESIAMPLTAEDDAPNEEDERAAAPA